MGRRRGGAAVAAVDDLEEAVDGAGASPAESAREELPIPSPRYVAPGELQMLPLATLVDSPTQPRQAYDEGYIAQLAASIATNGLQQPPTVRVRGDADGWEIVVGHCRVRAARRAGLEEIPVIVRDMSNSEVAVAQLVENLQRRDLSALDEAEALRRLVDAPGNTVPSVARDLGLSVSQVYTRLKLLDLVSPARSKLAEGKLSASIAVLLARVPRALQERALEELLPPWDDEREVSVRAAQDILSSRYLKRLDRARWSLEDAALVPEAGACNACPYRNFAEDDSDGARDTEKRRGAAAGAALCLEPRCYDAKQAAYNARVLEAARDAGRTVVEGDKAEKLLVETEKGGGTHVDASQVQFWDQRKVRTWADIADAACSAGDAVPEAILVVGSDGELHEVFPKRAAEKMAERVKARLDAGRVAKAKSDNAPARADFEAEVKKHQAEEKAFEATLAELYERSSSRKPALAEWRVLVDLLELELGAGQGVAQPAEFAQPGEAFSVCLRLGVMNLGDRDGLDGWLERACAVYRIPTPAERVAGAGADAGKPKAKQASKPARKLATKKKAKRGGKANAGSKRRKS